MASEAHGYILKPFDERQLYTAIEMALHKGRKDRSAGENQQAMAAILRSLKDAVIATDLNGRVTFVNPAAKKVTGWQQRSAVGRDLTEVSFIVDEADGHHVPNLARRAIRENNGVGLVNHRVLNVQDGSTVPTDRSSVRGTRRRQPGLCYRRCNDFPGRDRSGYRR